MIQVSRINGKAFFINSDLIEVIEVTPDTIITLRDGKKFVVSDTPDEIVEKIIRFKKRIFDNISIINI